MYIVLRALGPLGPNTLLVQHTYTCTALYLYRTLRAPAADVLNVPNVKFLAHLAHQTQK